MSLTFDDDRLQDSALPHRRRELIEAFWVDEAPGLLRIRMQLLNRDGSKKNTLTTYELPCDERYTSHCSRDRFHRGLLSPPHRPKEPGASERRSA